ncbi:hypothetical protein P525_02829, partial [Staphylococcus aureus M1377]
LFQEPGVEIEPLPKKYVSEDIVASENLTRERVANVFQLPSVLLNQVRIQISRKMKS